MAGTSQKETGGSTNTPVVKPKPLRKEFAPLSPDEVAKLETKALSETERRLVLTVKEAWERVATLTKEVQQCKQAARQAERDASDVVKQYAGRLKALCGCNGLRPATGPGTIREQMLAVNLYNDTAGPLRLAVGKQRAWRMCGYAAAEATRDKQ